MSSAVTLKEIVAAGQDFGDALLNSESVKGGYDGDSGNSHPFRPCSF
jgi:hypothetical protein